MNKQQLDFLVGKAKELQNHSDAYITAQLYSQFSGIASTRVIQLAVNKMRGQEIVISDEDIKYILFWNVEFVRIENEMKKRALDLVEKQKEFMEVIGVSIPQSNRILNYMCEEMKKHLLTEYFLHEGL